MKKYLISTSILLLTAAFIIGGVSATFNYAKESVSPQTQIVQGSVVFDYYPAGFTKEYQKTVEAAVPNRGGLNQSGTGTGGTSGGGYGFMINNICDTVHFDSNLVRENYGYVGTMDTYWYQYFDGVQGGISVVLTVSDDAITNKKPLYMYLAATDDLDTAAFDEEITVFRVKIEYIDGKYFATEYLKGKSKVVYYEPSTQEKSFAMQTKQEIWRSID